MTEFSKNAKRLAQENAQWSKEFKQVLEEWRSTAPAIVGCWCVKRYQKGGKKKVYYSGTRTGRLTQSLPVEEIERNG